MMDNFCSWIQILSSLVANEDYDQGLEDVILDSITKELPTVIPETMKTGLYTIDSKTLSSTKFKRYITGNSVLETYDFDYLMKHKPSTKLS